MQAKLWMSQINNNAFQRTPAEEITEGWRMRVINPQPRAETLRNTA
jgi:hypothetical protein